MIVKLGRPAFEGRTRRAEPQAIINVHNCGRHELLEVIDAVNSAGGFLCAAEDRQQHASQDGDDRDHDEKFDQREGQRLGGLARLSLVPARVRAFSCEFPTVRDHLGAFVLTQ